METEIERKERSALEDRLAKYRSIRDQIHCFAWSLVSIIVTELKTKGYRQEVYRKNGKVDLTLKLLGQQLVKLEKTDEKIKDIVLHREVVEDVRKSQEFYLKMLNQISDAVKGVDTEKLTLLNFECLFPPFQLAERIERKA